MSTYILHNNQNKQHIIQYNPTIQAFCHHFNNRPKIVCEAWDLSDPPASECFRQGFDFLPRDIQRSISTYSTKYGDVRTNDASPQSTQKHILTAPATKKKQKIVRTQVLPQVPEITITTISRQQYRNINMFTHQLL